MNYDTVIAVDENDQVIDYLDKMEAHRKGILHRAISVFIFNSNGEWLLQQRAADKYHSALLWTNTSCTHPLVDESNEDAAKRRLWEEMGLNAELTPVFTFLYRAELENELIENELDHIFIGFTDNKPKPNSREVKDYRYISTGRLEEEMATNPEQFTAWFKLLMPQVKEKL